MPVFPAIFEHVAGNLLSVDGSATQLPAILLAILLGVDAPLDVTEEQHRVLHRKYKHSKTGQPDFITKPLVKE